MVCPVQSRPDQIVHGSIDHQEKLSVVIFSVENRSEQRACRTDDRPARFEQQADIQSAQGAGYGFGVTRNAIGKLQARFLIGYAKSASGIDEVDAMSIRA